ncbi:uncharacterized protein LOC113764597 isoform X2 [Coffea eugenioides]|nr:uncharacterized protein LOC113764597 isoform X2 [Coffea eugenioides]XP_027164343.1 uncharacterized protein LOC113764597 isoform X2 [Coffea eugenioides]XP_027164344.1 uncharacterized protein LOC113764597 isoform X2 [Coffea eugenioides]
MEPLRGRNQKTGLTAVERKICVYYPDFHGGKFGKLWVFGPNYRRFGTEFSVCFKEEAMERIRSNSQISFQGVMNAIRNMESEVRAAYADDVVKDLTWPQIQDLMIQDGCFFLLLAFSILGADSQKLKYAENHPVFGVGCATEYMDNILESMFFVGNQIPFMVLEELMHLDIFQRMKATIGSKQQQLGLAKRTLYKFLMVKLVPKPVDLLHCLQSIMLGPKRSSNAAVRKKVDDIEDCVSASKLSEQGVRFRKLGGELGIRGMHYECNKFSAVLYLPDLGVDRYTDLLIKCLLKYETVQERQGVEPEASSYFKFMSDLIHKPKDIEILVSEGVIHGRSERLQGLLSTLDGMASSGYMHSVKREIVRNPPWQWQMPLKCIPVICSALIVLSIMQMYHSMLSFDKLQKP